MDEKMAMQKLIEAGRKDREAFIAKCRESILIECHSEREHRSCCQALYAAGCDKEFDLGNDTFFQSENGLIRVLLNKGQTK